MGYYSSAFVFFGVEIERPSNDKMDSFHSLNGEIIGIRTGCMATGEHERYWLAINESYSVVLEDKSDIRDAVKITGAKLKHSWYPTLGRESKEWTQKPDSFPSWVVASSGG